jgi:hypothetical protein
MNDLIRNCKNKADPPGFEPRQRDSKSLVLPLHQGSKSLVSPSVTPLPQQGWTQSRFGDMEPPAGVALQLEEKIWSQQSGLNRRPLVYKTNALPLSYAGIMFL